MVGVLQAEGGSGGCDKERDGNKKSGSSSDSSGDRTGSPSSHNSDKCCRCGKIGHWARECRNKPKHEEHAHVA
jgi:hypothetical protein